MNRAARRLTTPHLGRQTREPPRFGGGLNAHHLVMARAMVLAEEAFEVYMRDNGWYRKMRAEGRVTELQARKVFVERVAPRMLEDARRDLTDMLLDDNISESVKQDIADALILDSDLRAKRFVAAENAHIPSVLH